MKDKFNLDEVWDAIEDVISSGGEFQITPNGISMLPLLRPGIDTVVLVSPNEIKAGDIVLYKHDSGKYILHRVMYLKDGKYLMSGDNQTGLEYGVTDEHILAKVKDMYREGIKVDTQNRQYKKYVKSQLKKGKIVKFFDSISQKIKRKHFEWSAFNFIHRE